MANHMPYGTIVKHNNGRVYQVIDTLFSEEGERRAILEFAEDEEVRGELQKIIVVPMAELEIVKDRKQINQARTRTRSATR